MLTRWSPPRWATAAISRSWAQQAMDWTRRLPEDVRDDADAELLAAAANGASLADLAQIAEELARVHAEPDADAVLERDQQSSNS